MKKLQAAVIAVAAVSVSVAAARAESACLRLSFEGEVTQGQEWKASIGQGWVFRVVPIGPAQAGYSGWDLVVDREQAAGFPDALLLATPPYGSLNEREIGTTFGLRSQDAIGWNPRSFHFVVDPGAFADGQRVFRSALERGGLRKGDPALEKLMGLEKGAATGEFHIVDARIAEGVADPAAYAQGWALAAARTPHSVEPVEAGQASGMGKLMSLRFTLTLWLPGRWHAPQGPHTGRFACPE